MNKNNILWWSTRYIKTVIQKNFCFFCLFVYLFIYGCVGSFVSVWGLSLVVASGGHSSSRCTGLSLLRPLLLWSTGSVIVAHGPSCSTACGIFPDQGSNPCPLHWQADSQPLCHQGSLLLLFNDTFFFFSFFMLLFNDTFWRANVFKMELNIVLNYHIVFFFGPCFWHHV